MKVQEEGADDEMPEEGEMSNENQVNKVKWKRNLDLLTLKKGLEIVVGTSPLAYTMITLWPIRGSAQPGSPLAFFVSFSFLSFSLSHYLVLLSPVFLCSLFLPTALLFSSL